MGKPRVLYAIFNSIGLTMTDRIYQVIANRLQQITVITNGINQRVLIRFASKTSELVIHIDFAVSQVREIRSRISEREIVDIVA